MSNVADDPDRDPVRPKDYTLDALLHLLDWFDREPDAPPAPTRSLFEFLERLERETPEREVPVVGIMLTVGGLAVAGTITSHSDWLTGISDLLRVSGAPARFTEALTTSYKGTAQDWDDERIARDELGASPLTARWIHLRGARIYTGPKPIDVPLWRGNLSDVTGWAFWDRNAK